MVPCEVEEDEVEEDDVDELDEEEEVTERVLAVGLGWVGRSGAE